MIYLIVNKKDREIIKTTDYSIYQNTLESLGSHPRCNFFHMIGLTEEDFSTMLYIFTDSGEAPFEGFRLIDKN